MMKKLLFIILIILILPVITSAAPTVVDCLYGETGTCRQAESCSAEHINAAIAASATGGYGTMTSGGLPRSDGTFDGDGVYIPDCSSTNIGTIEWSDKNINLRGLNNCTLDAAGLPTSCGTNLTGGFQINVTDAGGRKTSFKLSNFAISSELLINYNNSNPHSTAVIAGYFRVHHLKITRTGNQNFLQHYGVVFGLYDHLDIAQGAIANPFLEQSEYLNSEYGDAPDSFMGEFSARLPTPRGTINNVYIEDSKFTITASSGLAPLSDSESGPGHLVFRYNTVTSAGAYVYFYAHWTRADEWDGAWREFYNNKMTCTDCDGWPFRLESGSGVIYNNQMSGWTDNTVHVDEGRGCGGSNIAHMYDCDGTMDWDMNAGDASAPGWPCAGQIGVGCLSGTSCDRGDQDNIPLILWNNGTQEGCATGGACTNSVTVAVINQDGDADDTCVRATSNYIKKTAHTASVSKFNGAVDYSDGNSSMPATVGTYTNDYAAYTYPHPLRNEVVSQHGSGKRVGGSSTGSFR